MTKFTAKQISNAHSRTSSLAYDVVLADQTNNFAATEEQLTSERGAAMCAAGFAAAAVAHLQNGDYQRFLTDIGLAGTFAAEADSLRFNRTPR